MNMTMQQAMKERHTVRKFTDQTIDEQQLADLKKRVDEDNRRYDVDISVETDQTNGVSGIIRLLMTKNVRNYLILASTDRSNVDVALGEAASDLMLYAKTIGLDTWYIGGTWNRKSVESETSAQHVIGIIVFGYGENHGKPHASKTVQQVSKYKGEAPQWFVNGVQAALLAPTPLNKQPFFITGKGNAVSIQVDGGIFKGADEGIVRHHFELGAGKHSFSWKL